MTSTTQPGRTPQLIRSFPKRVISVAFLMAYLAAQPVMAQPSSRAPTTKVAADKMVAIDIPTQPDAIELGTGPLPIAPATAPAREAWHSQYNSKFARNVAVATLTPFLPEASKATGAAVIVAPGGGFRTLSMENEGSNVARALADKGVAAFVLKYRLNQTPADFDEFARTPMGGPPPSKDSGGRPATRPSPGDMAARIAPMIADANAAFALVRANAAKWHVDPDRIGMIGFSAG